MPLAKPNGTGELRSLQFFPIVPILAMDGVRGSLATFGWLAILLVADNQAEGLEIALLVTVLLQSCRA